MKEVIINKMNIKNKIIYWWPAIPLLGLIPMILYSAFNDETEERLCIKDPNNTVCCFLIQLYSVIILLIELNILPV